MFTGFASENTPAIQVWDCWQNYNGTTVISLPDDCAPIQFFKTGCNATSFIIVYLPSAPIEGKTITIIAQRYGDTPDQPLSIRSSDTSGNGATSQIAQLRSGGSLTFVYSKNIISYGSQTGFFQSGWMPLSQAPQSAVNANSAVIANFGGSASAKYALAAGGDFGTASATYSAVIGGTANTASGQAAFVGGGSSNTASGANAFVGGGNGNTASNTNAFVGGGNSNIASGNGSAVIGSSNTANATFSSVIGGGSCTASAAYAAVFGGNNNFANAGNSVAIGGRYGDVRSIVGNFVISASNGPIAASVGRQQLATLLLGRQTTDATATVLTSNTVAASTTNQVILANNSAYTFQGTCVANVTGGGDSSGWKFEGVIKRGANAASTALVAAVTPLVIAQDVGAVTWVLAITADTTNGGIKVEVTGAAATTIRWVCKIETTEVTF